MDSNEMRGLNCDIYQSPRGNFSNDGISAKFNEVCIVGVADEVHGRRGALRMFAQADMVPFKRDGVPAAIVVRRRMGSEVLLHVEPLTELDDRTGTPWMAGGAFVGTSDSRLRKLIGEGAFYGALSLHDRTETWDQYTALSS